MMPSTKLQPRRSAALALVSAVLLACQLLVPGQKSPVASTTRTAGQPSVMPTPAASEAAGQAAPAAAGPGAGPLVIRDTYALDATHVLVGSSVAASPGKVWVGTTKGTIEEFDGQSGRHLQSIALEKGGSMGDFVTQLEYDGRVIAAFEQLMSGDLPHTFLFLIDPASGSIVRKWDMQSAEWNEEASDYRVTGFGVSPGKVWIEGRVIDTKTFEITRDVYTPMYTRFGYNGNGWMWMTGDTGGDCDDLVFAPVNDPTHDVCKERLPFAHSNDPLGDMYPDTSIMALAGDRMWIVISGKEPGDSVALGAYPADMDKLMQQTGPLASVPLAKNTNIALLYAGNYLWLLWEGGDDSGVLYKLNPQTGQTLDRLDFLGDDGRHADMPVGLAADGHDLWIMTMFSLLRVKL